MSLDPELVGLVYPSTPPMHLSRSTIAAFAAAVGADDPVHRDPDAARAAGNPDVVAPPTFPIVVAFPALEAFLADPRIGIELRNVVHADQRFTAVRPVVAGDVLTARLHVESLRTIGGADIIGTRTDITTTEGAPVCTATATLAHRPPDPAP